MVLKLTKGDLLMASATFVWGFSYILMKWGLDSCTPMQLIFLRCFLSFPLLLLIFNKKIIPNKTELIYSFLLAILFFSLSIGYNFGLKPPKLPLQGSLPGQRWRWFPFSMGF